eukprot:c22974_g2_i2 orf=275-568(-)
MALRQILGVSTGEVMRDDAMPCSRCTWVSASVAAVGGVFCSWALAAIQHGPRVTWPRIIRWQVCGAALSGASMALYIRLWEPACEPQNIAAYDKPVK